MKYKKKKTKLRYTFSTHAKIKTNEKKINKKKGCNADYTWECELSWQ